MGRKILGKNLSISEFSPEDEVFHVNEVINYYDAVFQYYLDGKKEDKKAQEALELMEVADIEHSLTRHCAAKLISFRMEKMSEMFEKRKEYKTRTYDKTLQTEDAPTFHHPEIQQLYENGMRIDHGILKEILALPRKTLIEDLEKVVSDAIYRYEYFDKKTDDDWNDTLTTFPIHAIFLLNELDAKDSLPVIWDLLKQSYDISEFWFSDHKTETLWKDFYKLGNDNLAFLKSCIIEPEIEQFCKSAPSTALEQIALHQPEKKEAVIDCFKDIFTDFLEIEAKGEPIDTGLMGSLIADVLHLRANDLLPIIRVFYEKDLVDLFVCGDYEDVAKDMTNPPPFDPKMDIPSDIFERYTEITSTWHGYSKEYEEQKANVDKPSIPTPAPFSLPSPNISDKPKLSKKVGRNDPCVCGSGKKFKKCCIKKYK